MTIPTNAGALAAHVVLATLCPPTFDRLVHGAALSFRRRAAHDPVQNPRHSRPPKRCGGSDESPSLAPISPTSMLLDWLSRTDRAALVHTPDAV